MKETGNATKIPYHYLECIRFSYPKETEEPTWLKGGISVSKRNVTTHHPSLWKFLEFLRKDQRENEIVMQQLAAGHTFVPVS